MASTGLIDALGHSLADKRIDILRGIGRTGSISQAARDAAVSYKAAWQAIATLTNLAGVALVERSVGGAGGGGAKLTPQATQLLGMADAMALARQGVQAAGGGSAAGLLAVRTSMRNQLPVVIETLARTGRVVRVGMRLGGGQGVVARITLESAELLGLAPGMAAIALCKATAVRVLRAATAQPDGNRLEGAVASVARGDRNGDEIALTLPGGLQLVGFAEGGSGLRRRQRAVASVDEAAVVVALPG